MFTCNAVDRQDACCQDEACMGRRSVKKSGPQNEETRCPPSASRLGDGQRPMGNDYEYSPPIAATIADHGWLRAVVRVLLLPVVGMVSLLT